MYEVDKIQYLQIGVQGENDATDIEIDMSAWVEKYPNAVFHLLFKPYNAAAPSPMVTTYEDGVLTWTVDAGATAVVGVGYTEIRAQDSETGLVKKTRIIPTAVENSVSGASADPPASYQAWVTTVLNAGTDAKNSAAAAMAFSQGKQIRFEIGDDDAPTGMSGHLLFYFKDEDEEEWEDYLDLGPVDAYGLAVLKGYTGTKEQWATEIGNASTNAQTASQKASDSEAYAKGTRGGEAVDSDDPAYHNNSKYYDEQAALEKASAQAAAATASAAYNTNLLAPVYDATATYTVGAHVIYSGGYYECISAISTAEAWTEAHWRQLTVGGEAADLKSALDIQDDILDKVIFTENPCVDLSGYIYYQPEDKLTTAQNSVVRRYSIQPNTDYYATTSYDGTSTSVWLVSYFSVTNDYISSEYQNTANGSQIKKAKLNIPANAAWFYINGRNATPFVESAKVAETIEKINRNLIFEVEPTVKTDGYAYYQPENRITSISNAFKVYKYNIEENAEYYISTSIVASSAGFPLIAYFDSSNNFISSEYMNSTTGTTAIEYAKAVIPSGASWFYVNARDTTPYVGVYKSGTLESIYTNVKKHDELLTKVNIQPIAVIPGYGYVNTDHNIHTVANGTVKKIKVESGVSYYVTTSFIGSDAVFPLIAYFDSSNDFISYEYMNQANVATAIKDQLLTVPANADWFYVNSRPGDSIIYTISDPPISFAEFEKTIGTGNSHEISILFVGNSLTQDGIAYLPYLLRNYYPDIRFKFYIWYNGGYNLAQQYAKFVDNGYCEIFSIAEDSAAWTNMILRMSDVLSMYKFDIVCMQEYFNHKTSYTDEDLTDWNNCRDYITSHYTGGNGLEFVTLFHAPKRSDAQSVFDLTLSGNGLELQKTIADDMIPNGIAVYRALSTDLDDLGDEGHLSPDGIHTQEGLPCLLQTYVTACWLFDRLGLARSVYGCPMRMTTAIYNTINVPGPNLGTGVITGTDTENLLAQEVAIQAYKEGKQFVINSIYSNN